MPRPSSPVHAKASTNCPYLTLENPHHQRQFWNSRRCGAGRLHKAPVAAHPEGSATTQLDKDFRIRHAPSDRLAEATRSSEPHAVTASISRTHSQCQRWGQIPRSAARPRNSGLHLWRNSSPPPARAGGASRDRTDDLKLAKLALSQLSYGPADGGPRRS